MVDTHRLTQAVPCLRCKRTTKNASRICSNHRDVKTQVPPQLNSLPNRNISTQATEQRNIEFINNAPIVTVEGNAAIIDEAFTLGSVMTDEHGEPFMNDPYDVEVTSKGRLIRQDNRLIIESGTAEQSQNYAEEISNTLWSQAIKNYNIECETYQDVAQAASQFEEQGDIDYRSTKDGKLKVIFTDQQTGNDHGILFTPKSDEYEHLPADSASGRKLYIMEKEDVARNARKLSELQFITDIFYDCSIENNDGTVSIPKGWNEL